MGEALIFLKVGVSHKPTRHSPVVLGTLYAAADDPYCYRGTTVFKDRLGLREQNQLDRSEPFISAQRADVGW